MYGYEITQHVKERTEGALELTEGALYPTLHKLEAEGFLQTEKVYIGKRARRYYTLTPSGVQASRKKLEEFRSFVRVMNLLLQPNSQGHGHS